MYSGMELLFDEKELFGRDTSSSVAKWSIPVLISICLKIKTITDSIKFEYLSQEIQTNQIS